MAIKLGLQDAQVPEQRKKQHQPKAVLVPPVAKSIVCHLGTYPSSCSSGESILVPLITTNNVFNI
jgi:hypothetical protein